MKTRPQFKTVAGRTVYGGGGIYPDVVIKDPPNLTRAEVDFITKRVGLRVRDALGHASTPASSGPRASFDPHFQLGADEWTTLQGQLRPTKKIDA